MSNENAPAGNDGLSVVWSGPSYEVQNGFGLWRQDEPRTDLTETQAATLGPGFVVTRLDDPIPEAVAEAPILPPSPAIFTTAPKPVEAPVADIDKKEA